MMTDKSFINEYYRLSKNILYSIIFILPIFIIHQIFNAYFEIFRNVVVIKSAEKSFRSIFQIFGKYDFLSYSVFSTIIIVSIIIYNFDILKNKLIQFRILFFMIIESYIWALLLLLFLSWNPLLSISSSRLDNVLYKINICLGAGFWEELIFRFFCISLIIFIYSKILRFQFLFSAIIAIVISSSIFSILHLDFFNISQIYSQIFLSRFLAGIFLGILYIYRGLGISTYAHVFYDIIVFFDLLSLA